MRRTLASLIVRGFHRLEPWMAALEQTAATGELIVPGIYPYPTFLARLGEETARAGRYQLELGVVVFQVPNSARSQQQRWKLEVALRDCLRKADIAGRLSEETLAAVLPETGRGTPAAAERIAELLLRAGAGSVSSGYACYPNDGQTAPQLIQAAIERTMRECPPIMAAWEGSDRDPKLVPTE
jgi:diguanylate cyclase with GGDEF domain